MMEPPARYNHPYDGQVIEQVMSPAQVAMICVSHGAFGAACSWKHNGVCHILLPKGDELLLAFYRRHEMAHCNGWSYWHTSGHMEEIGKPKPSHKGGVQLRLE
jgi:hypothetical protein